MNLVDLDRTGVQDACLHVRDLAQRHGTDVAASSWSACSRGRELDRCTDDFLQWSRHRRGRRRSKCGSARGRAGGPATRCRTAPERGSRRWRGRGGRARAGGGCGGVPARTCRPRSRTSRRGAGRTRGTRSRTSQPPHTAFASFVDAPRSGKNRSGSTPRQLARSCHRRSAASTSSWISISLIGCPLAVLGSSSGRFNKCRRWNYSGVILAAGARGAQGGSCCEFSHAG